MLLNAIHHCCLVSYERTLYIFGVNEIINFQKLVGNLNKMIIVDFGRQH